MVDLIKGLRVVEIYGICVMIFQEVFQDSVYMLQQLGEAASTFSETMLQRWNTGCFLASRKQAILFSRAILFRVYGKNLKFDLIL